MKNLNQIKKRSKILTKVEQLKIVGQGTAHLTCADGITFTYRNVEFITTEDCVGHGGHVALFFSDDL